MTARFACFTFLCGFAALAPAIKLAQDGTAPVIKNVEYAKGLIHCPKGVRHDDAGTCEQKSLLLDVYPAQATANESGPLFPAILLVHGAANKFGSKDMKLEVSRANTYAKKGFVVFVPNYRLEPENGTYPGYDFDVGLSPWHSLYPAVRDVKAAARFIRAKAGMYAVDRKRVVAAGTSAGGMDVLAAFTSSRNAFTKELSLEDDPTLNTTNVRRVPEVKAIIVHSGPPWGIQQYERFWNEQPGAAEFAPAWKALMKQGISFVHRPPPLIQFHGDSDTLINVSNATVTQDMYTSKGVNSELHVLKGKGHSDWTFGCNSTTSDYCAAIDNMAIDFVYKAFKEAP